MNAEEIRIESDENGWELHILTTDDDWQVFNIHGCAVELLEAVNKTIGPWWAEGLAVKAEVERHDPYADDEEGPWPGESVQAYYQRTGQDGPLREVADAMNKTRKES